MATQGGAFSWNGPYGGAWNSAGNWTDLGASATAVVPPGSLDRASVVGGLTPLLLTGSGEAAALATYRSVLLAGQFSAGTVDVEGTLAVAGMGGLLAIGALGEAGAAVASSIQAQSGATVTVAGSASLGSLGVLRGGRARLSGPASLSGLLSVDSASCAEIGGTGSFWAGWLKVYAGGTLAASGTIDAAVALSGTILASGLRIDGMVLGTGQVRLDASGVSLGQVASGVQVVFAAAGAVLSLSAPGQMAASLSGFGVGDGIDLAVPVSSAAFRPAGAASSTLVLSGAQGVVASLTLSGPPAAHQADRFLLLPDGAGGTLVLEVPGPLPGAAGPGNATPHRDVWAGLSGAAWNDAASWADRTSGGAAVVAPGSLDSVVLVGGALPLVVTGAGAAAAIATHRSVLLAGRFSAATMDVEGTLIVAGNGLGLGGLGEQNAAGASSILVSGATLTVAGAASLGALSMQGGRAQFGTLQASAGLTVDAAGCVEIGGRASFWAGWVKVYAGGTLAASGAIGAATVVVGTVLASGVRFDGLLVGSGQVRIDSQGASVGTVLAGLQLVFAGPGAVLTLTAPAVMAGTLVGLAGGDALDLPGTVTTVVYRAVAAGSGVLSVATTSGAIAALAVAGDSAALAASRFLLLPDGAGGTFVLDVPPAIVQAPGAGNASPHRLIWTGLSGASWAAASSWRDLTTAQSPAAVAPGARDSVSIVGDIVPVVVTGSGAAAAMATFRSVLLDGAFAAATADVEGTLTVAGAGSTVSLGALGQAGAAIASSIVVNGAQLTVAGSASLGSATVLGGARAGLGQTVAVSGGIAVDRSSCAEIGTGGSAWAGWVKVYAGATLSGTGPIAGPAVVSGTVLSSGMRFGGQIVGAGQIRMDASGATVGQVAAGLRLVFAAAGAVLTCSAPGQMAGTLAGFGAGDGIDLPGLGTASTAAFAARDAGSGTLSLYDGRHAVLAAFAMAGDSAPYQAASFSVLPDGGGGVLVTETAAVNGAAGFLTHPS